MKRFFTLLLLFVSINTFSQIWADSGATWHYGFTGIISQGFVSIELIGDSTILGIEAQKLEVFKSGIDFMSGQYFESILGYEYTYSDSDRVYHKVGDEFKVLYDFSAEIGDTLFHYLIDEFMNPYCDSIGRSIVSEKGIEIINNEELRWYEVEYLDGEVTFYGRIYEKLGAMGFMFPNNDLCILDEDYYGPFRCYSDSSFGEYISPEYTGDCEYVPDPIPLYLNMLGPNVWWYERLFQVEGPESWFYYIKTNGDTLINDYTYNKLFFGTYSTEHNGYIRETYDGKVYFRLDDNYDPDAFCFGYDVENYFPLNEDLLLIDFSAEMGDTIDIFYFEFPDAKIVINDIYTDFIAGEERRVLYFSGVDMIPIDGEWIEGIGCSSGLFGSWCPFGFGVGYNLLCYGVDDVVVYSNYSNCTVGINEYSSIGFEFNLNPNPATEILHIEISPSIQLKGITIYNLSGQLILTQNPSTSLPAGQAGSGRHTLDLSQLQSGMYLLEVESMEGYREVKRFVVE